MMTAGTGFNAKSKSASCEIVVVSSLLLISSLRVITNIVRNPTNNKITTKAQMTTNEVLMFMFQVIHKVWTGSNVHRWDL